MGIDIRVKHTDYRVTCANYKNWKDLTENCPLVEKVFRNEVFKDKDGNIFPGKYLVSHKDPRLRKLVSEVTLKYLIEESYVYDAISNLAKEICQIAHKSMSRKKDLEVAVLWRENL